MKIISQFFWQNPQFVLAFGDNFWYNEVVPIIITLAKEDT